MKTDEFLLIDLQLVAHEIKYVGLYDYVLQDCLALTNTTQLSEEEIYSLLCENSEILESYKKINLENNISNIHAKDIELNILESEKLNTAKKINGNLNILRDIEKYTLNFEDSPTLVFIFSVEFFVLFSVQYFIVLLGLKNWQFEIYGLFLMSIVAAYYYAKNQKQKYEQNNIKYTELYLDTHNLLKQFHA